MHLQGVSEARGHNRPRVLFPSEKSVPFGGWTAGRRSEPGGIQQKGAGKKVVNSNLSLARSLSEQRPCFKRICRTET